MKQINKLFKGVLLFICLSVLSYGKVNVTTTIFPIYDLVREIGGDKVDATMVVPFGGEVHSYSPTPRDIVQIQKSDLFIYTEDSLESFGKNIKTKKVLVVGSGLINDSADSHENHATEDHHHHEEDIHHHLVDPHIWLVPRLYIIMGERVTNALGDIDPSNKSYYVENYNTLKDNLVKLDTDIKSSVRGFTYDTILYSGHFSFNLFAKEYGLHFLSTNKGISPNSSVTPKNYQEIISRIESEKRKYLFKESLKIDKGSEIISKETGVEILTLRSLGSISKDDYNKGYSYLDLMYKNLDTLKKGLEYQEN